MSETLGKDLLNENLINQKQFDDAMELQQTVGGSLEDILIKLNFVREVDLCKFKASKQGLEFRLLDDFEPLSNVMNLLTKEKLLNNQVVPLHISDTVIQLAMSHPENVDIISEIEFKTNKSVRPVLSTPHSIDKCLNKYFYGKNKEEEEKKTKEPWEYTIDHIYSNASSNEISDLALYLKSLTQALIVEKKLDRNDLSRFIRINFKLDEIN